MQVHALPETDIQMYENLNNEELKLSDNGDESSDSPDLKELDNEMNKQYGGLTSG